ncbi:hypothetical protein IQ266_13390 [filamentous cyanobacterium LEGE 11480]|uniref:Uncharacterized protein n=1 Tax=Romeriopsis navalis LEGE 11480 TaxID=2777977 RepID=A0A928Z4Z9_9CYAN|nr:hypothetical protein [Romeriopsis navalis]MBE9030725.1 hypothetical protein [Romeriopsis navalis LEGE 11480]
MAEELIILTDDDFEPDGDRKGWDEPLRRVTGKVREVTLGPAEVEAKMSAFVRSVEQIFQRTNSALPPESGL